MKSKFEQEPDIKETLEMNHSSIFGRRLKLYVVIALVTIISVAAVIIWKKSGTTALPQYKTEKVQRGDLTVIVTATGTLQPINTISVGSELSGIIKSVEVDYNNRVKVGQVLARLDTSKLEAQITQSKAVLESAKASLEKALSSLADAKRTMNRNKELVLKGLISQSDFDTAETNHEAALSGVNVAKAAVSQAQATLQANETDLYKSVIRSPINGVVLTRSIDPGQTVAASFQAPVLFTLARDLTQMELHVNVDEADIGKIKEGQKATFSVSSYPDRTFEGLITLSRYASSTTSGVVTYETVLKVDNTDLALRPGMTATADITGKKVENATLVPSAALRFAPPMQQEEKPSAGLVGSLLPHPPSNTQQRTDTAVNGKQQRVWVLKNGQLSPVSVTTGSTSGGLTEVLSTDLQPSMDVVVDSIASAK